MFGIANSKGMRVWVDSETSSFDKMSATHPGREWVDPSFVCA